MSLSFAIKSANDNELSTIFTQFISKNSFHLHKTVNQISYKCYEASWCIQQLKIKSNGYGRTEYEANKHVLRNICDILIQYQSYSQYFYHHFNNKSTQSNNNQQQNINKPITNKTNLTKVHTKFSHQYEGEEKENLKETKKKYSYLLHKLNQILQENNKLRQAIQLKQLNSNLVKTNEVQQYKIKQTLSSKVKIPKLNLSTLPNYHKKTDKSMNGDLLDAYNQKCGMSISFQ